MSRDRPTDGSSAQDGHPSVKQDQDEQRSVPDSPEKDAEVLPDDPDVEGLPGELNQPG